MFDLLVDGIEDELVGVLEQRARRNGRSAEDEVREILRHALESEGEEEGAEAESPVEA